MIPLWAADPLLAAMPRPRLAIADGLTGGGIGQFDVLVGNPPFAGAMALPPETALSGQYLWASRLRQGRSGCRLPRELWFLERAVRLLFPGGVLGLVLPEGVLANRRWRGIRAALLAETQLEAIVGLPRRTFRHSRTHVKTCLLVATCQTSAPGHMVRLAELDEAALARGPEELIAVWEAGATVAAGCPWTLSPRRSQRQPQQHGNGDRLG
jgi:hypothetical protein